MEVFGDPWPLFSLRWLWLCLSCRLCLSSTASGCSSFSLSMCNSCLHWGRENVLTPIPNTEQYPSCLYNELAWVTHLLQDRNWSGWQRAIRIDPGGGIKGYSWWELDRVEYDMKEIENVRYKSNIFHYVIEVIHTILDVLLIFIFLLVVLRMGPLASHIPGRHFTTGKHPHPWLLFSIILL